MADLSSAIREMLKKGQSEQQVVANLRELGVSNPEQVFRQATEAFKAVSPPRGVSSSKLESMSVGGEGGEEKRPQSQKASSANGAVQQPVESISSRPQAVAENADDIVAMLRALLDINKKILEANRDILLRLKQ